MVQSPTQSWAIGRVLFFWIGYAGILLLTSLPKGMVPPAFGQLVWGLLASLALIALTAYALRRDGRQFHEVGLRLDGTTPQRALIGVAIGCAVFGLTFLVDVVVAGPMRLVAAQGPAIGTALLVLSAIVALSLMEELGFRGYPLRTLATALGPWGAQLVVALAFGLSHIAFGWPLQTVAFGVIPAALLFGVAAMVFGDLAVPVALHATLNIARWATGQTSSAGVWTISADEQTTRRLAEVAEPIGVVVTVLCTLAIFWYGHHRQKAQVESTPIPRSRPHEDYR